MGKGCVTVSEEARVERATATRFRWALARRECWDAGMLGKCKNWFQWRDGRRLVIVIAGIAG